MISSLHLILRGALPWLSPHAHHVLASLTERRGDPSPAAGFARSVGCSTRHQLARTLQREGLPGLEELGGWIRVLTWILAWEIDREALSRRELLAIRDPATAYRTVERITGRRWGEVKELGTAWVVLRLRERCRPPRAAGLGPEEAVG